MRPQRRSVDLLAFAGARNQLIPQPLGVVGVIVPWNYPLMLSFGPLVSIFAAGNRAMVKMSENSRRLAELLIGLSPKYFPGEKLAFFDDGGGRGPAFSSLPFDHLIFTGSGATGRAVMANAARNLTPVTLELGGKSPAIVAPDFPIKTAAERILWAKTLNAGQTCLAVDYVFLPRGKEGRVRRLLQATVREALSRHQRPRLHLDHRPAQLRPADGDARGRARQGRDARQSRGRADARPREAQVLAAHRPRARRPTWRSCGARFSGRSCRSGCTTSRQEVADAINAGDRPLGLYPFTNDRATRDFYISHVLSGGVSVNEAILHVAQHDLPFGGVGASGMGHYHGREGFETFSKLRPVFQQGPVSSVQMLMQPPHSGLARRMLDFMMRMRS